MYNSSNNDGNGGRRSQRPQHYDVWQQQQEKQASADDWSAVRNIPPSASSGSLPQQTRTNHNGISRSHFNSNNQQSSNDPLQLSASHPHGRTGGLVLDAQASSAGSNRTVAATRIGPHQGQNNNMNNKTTSSNNTRQGSSSNQQPLEQQQPMYSNRFSLLLQQTIPKVSQQAQPNKPKPQAEHASSLSQSSAGGMVSGKEQSSLVKQQQETHISPITEVEATTPTAAKFAQDAPLAGFLYKFGTHIPEFKRRFFVLQPATHLYYFLSPHDAQPRGCLDLSDSWIEENYRESDTEFAICWPDEQNNNDRNKRGQNGSTNHAHNRRSTRRVVLQAKTADEAKSWIESLRTQRLDVAQSMLATALNQTAGYKARVKELTVTLERYKLIELDRDGAVQDAQNCQKELDRLDQGVLQLAQMLQSKIRNFKRKIPKPDNGDSNEKSISPGTAHHVAATQATPDAQTGDDDAGETRDSDSRTWEARGSRLVPSTGEDGYVHGQNELDPTVTGDTGECTRRSIMGTKGDERIDVEKRCRNPENEPKRRIETSTGFNSGKHVEDEQDEISITQEQLNQIPGKHFGTLFNACLSLETNWKLAVQESCAAVQDLTTANTYMQQMQKRLSKAENQLLKLWEENCDIRRQLKQRKKEKRVLVQEVKNLHHQLLEQQQQAHQPQHQQLVRPPAVARILQHQDSNAVDGDVSDGTPIDTDEERILHELEEHVSTSIQLHEQMLRVKSPIKKQQFESKPAENHERTGANPTVTSGSNAEAKSLFDDFDEESEDDENSPDCYDPDLGIDKEDSEPGTSDTELATVSSIQAEMGDANDGLVEDKSKVGLTVIRSSQVAGDGVDLLYSPDTRVTVEMDRGADDSSSASTPYRPNPLLQLQNSNSPSFDEPKTTLRPRTLITNSGYATSALTCPLADVVGSPSMNQRFDGTSLNDELQVYHLTFYSRRIGLQFQKVPPPPVQSRGLLTEAMTADLAGVRVAGERTAAELRRIATLATWAKTDESPRRKGEVKEVALPVDAVLVCGLHGFDDSGSNVRPKLGARLVAFDGVSVEIGKWTFESIRRAIQIRGRPLTLSFRDDYLTTEQRQILTKAAREIEESMPPQHRGLIPHRDITAQSVSTVSVGSHEADHYMLEEESVRSGHSLRSVHFTTNADDDDDCVPFSSPQVPVATRRTSYKYRSFSEAGSSVAASSVLSAVGPLVSNLLSHKYANNNEPFTPEYMRRPNKSVEDTPQHQDFEAGLL
ncbi:hypothetical protein ACA910_002962 [Epithemia clementina (nom. ined.)]